jgi:hypothetical protein
MSTYTTFFTGTVRHANLSVLMHYVADKTDGEYGDER